MTKDEFMLHYRLSAQEMVEKMFLDVEEVWRPVYQRMQMPEDTIQAIMEQIKNSLYASAEQSAIEASRSMTTSAAGYGVDIDKEGIPERLVEPLLKYVDKSMEITIRHSAGVFQELAIVSNTLIEDLAKLGEENPPENS